MCCSLQLVFLSSKSFVGAKSLNILPYLQCRGVDQLCRHRRSPSLPCKAPCTAPRPPGPSCSLKAGQRSSSNPRLVEGEYKQLKNQPIKILSMFVFSFCIDFLSSSLFVFFLQIIFKRLLWSKKIKKDGPPEILKLKQIIKQWAPMSLWNRLSKIWLSTSNTHTCTTRTVL